MRQNALFTLMLQHEINCNSIFRWDLARDRRRGGHGPQVDLIRATAETTLGEQQGIAGVSRNEL